MSRLPAFLLVAFLSYIPAARAALQPVTGLLVNDGDAVPMTWSISGQTVYLQASDLSRLSGVPLSWQTASQKVGMRDGKSSFLINWKSGFIERDGRRVPYEGRVMSEGDRVYVPMSVVLTPEFAQFSDAEFTWDARLRKLARSTRVTIRIPPVERRGTNYRLRIALPSPVSYRVIDQTRNKIWLRFLRGRSEGSQILEGDQVLRRVRVVQRSSTADLIVEMGPRAVGGQVFYDDVERALIVDITADAPVVPVLKPAPEPRIAAPPAPVIRRDPAKPEPVIRAVVPAAKPAPRPQPVPRKTSRGLRVIVVDPGHGGIDSGAIGTRGTLEKDINFKVAKILVKELKRNKRFKVLMTRTKDEFIPLGRRTEIANEAQADLFVSVHCNSSLSARTSGFEVYILSPSGTDSAADAVAKAENSVIALETGGAAGSSKLGDLLASMAIYDFLNESSRCSSLVSRAVGRRLSGEAAVREANFFVLRGAQMPSMLVELDYLSNPVHELKLRSTSYQTLLVKAIVEGINAYDHLLRSEK